MTRQTREAAKYIAGILANIAVIGFGLALYQGVLWCADSHCSGFSWFLDHVENKPMMYIIVFICVLVLGGTGLYLTRKSD